MILRPACKPDPDASLLALVQWLSPAFPVGGFAYSHGLESLMAESQVKNTAQTYDFVSDILNFGSGRSDAILLMHAARPDSDADALADLARALAATAERLHETMELGAALARTTNALQGTDHPARPYPVALGVAARSLALAPRQLAQMYLHAFAASLIAAATRFLPLGQTEAQQALAALGPLILDLAAAVEVAPLSAITSATFAADIASARHETLDVRIFRT